MKLRGKAVRVRGKIVNRLPRCLTQYPFEMFMAATALLVPCPVLWRADSSSSVYILYPEWTLYMWAALCFYAGLSILRGLRKRRVRLVTTGSLLASFLFFIYSWVLLSASLGRYGWTFLVCSVLMSTVSAARGVHLKAVSRIMEG